VPAWIAVVGILLTLAVVELGYWRGLMSKPKALPRPPKGAEGGPPEAAAPPAGQPGVTVLTLAGRPEAGYQNGPAGEARFNGPAGVALGPDRAVYIADSRNNCIRKLSPDGSVSTLAGGPARGALGDFADGVAAAARFSGPSAVAIAPDGALLVCDTGNHRLRRVARDGMVSTYAGGDTERDDLGRPTGGWRDGPAAQAQFRYPVGLVVDSAGAVYVADAGNHRVRRVSPAGQVTTLATVGNEEMGAPTELALTSSGQLWVADTAGGALWFGPREGPLQRWQPAKEEKPLKAPAGLAAAGNVLYLVDAGDHCLLRLRDGRLSLVAGSREPQGSGYADGYGNLALFSSPAGLAIGRDGDLYLADFGNNCLRQIKVEPGLQ